MVEVKWPLLGAYLSQTDPACGTPLSHTGTSIVPSSTSGHTGCFVIFSSPGVSPLDWKCNSINRSIGRSYSGVGLYLGVGLYSGVGSYLGRAYTQGWAVTQVGLGWAYIYSGGLILRGGLFSGWAHTQELAYTQGGLEFVKIRRGGVIRKIKFIFQHKCY